MRPLLLELLIGAAVLAGATAAVASRYSGPELAAARTELAGARPAVVFLGNSTTREGIDVEAAREALGEPAIKLFGDGSGSALWWLLLKNVVAAAPVPPRIACILFRDHELTNPTLGLSGEPGMQLAATATGSEPELDRLGYRAAMGPLRHAAYRRWPLWRARDSAATLLDRFLRRRVAAPLLGVDPVHADAAWWNVLGDKRMDRARLTAYQLRNEDGRDTTDLDFDAQVERSFLPLMVERARAAGVELVLVRIRTRRDALGAPLPARNRRYGERAAAWCAGHGVPLFDYRGEASLTADLFGFGDHFTEEGARAFTGELCGRLRPLLGDGGAGGAGGRRR